MTCSDCLPFSNCAQRKLSVSVPECVCVSYHLDRTHKHMCAIFSRYNLPIYFVFALASLPTNAYATAAVLRSCTRAMALTCA